MSKPAQGTEQPGGARVLVIDDEEIVHASVGRILRRVGHRVDAVFSADEGLERLAAGGYDLAITDLMMPGKNGIELLGAIKAQGIRVPVIMITGYPTIRTALQAMRLGARDYLAKPFTRKELLSPVKRALHRQDDGAVEEQPGVAEAPAGEPGGGGGALGPGDVVYLPHHAWGRFRQDGLVDVGVERSFLEATGSLDRVDVPEEAALLDQGTVAVRLTNTAGEEHGVAMPLSGQVMEVNAGAVGSPGEVGPGTWLLRVRPSLLDQEVANLVTRKAGG